MPVELAGCAFGKVGLWKTWRRGNEPRFLGSGCHPVAGRAISAGKDIAKSRVV
jgi:hypothetical protein